jgi:hypothetical protein
MFESTALAKVWRPEPGPCTLMEGTAMYQFDDCKVKSPGLFLLDENSLNREALAPNTIRITRAGLKGHGQVPFVESTNMGPVMNLSLAVFDEQPSLNVVVATDDSLLQSKPVCCHSFKPQVARIKVGSSDSTLILDHDFDSGEVLQIFGNRVKSIMVFGGVDFSVCRDEVIGSILRVEYVDNPESKIYAVEYVHLECKDTGTVYEHHQVFRIPENHS